MAQLLKCDWDIVGCYYGFKREWDCCVMETGSMIERIGVFVVCICVYVQMRICTNVANDGTNVKDCLCSASFCEELSSV